MRHHCATACLGAGVWLLCAVALSGQTWHSVGPQGGDVRTIVADPKNPNVLYLGTSDGHIFTTNDGGERWRLLSRVGNRQDTVVFSLLVDQRDSRVLYATTWTLAPGGGGVFRSGDGGESWHLTGLAGQSVRAIAQAPSKPEVLVAGTLDGVYRSTDEGKNWARITPAEHADLRNFDSVAIDPRDLDHIYAGTYHSAWRTADGGLNWQPIHAGMIDDTDVMDIEFDSTDPERVFATASSGIYRSDNGGEQWKRIKGIPTVSRRTHFIRQHPRQPKTLFAGTTQGLWASTDGSRSWKRITPVDWSIIALVINPENPERMVLGVERRGVLISGDGGASFRAANEGFHHQQVVSLAVNPTNSQHMLVVLTNSVEPVQVTQDGGQTWTYIGSGYKPETVRRVFASPDGWWAALYRGGLLRFDEKKSTWVRAGDIVAAPSPPAGARRRRQPAPLLPHTVNDLAFSPDQWLAATNHGLLTSRDSGATWSPLALAGQADTTMNAVRISADGNHILALAANTALRSTDGGRTWSRHASPFAAADNVKLYQAGEQTFLVASQRGLHVSRDGGHSWVPASLTELFIEDVAVAGDVILVSSRKGGLHLSNDGGRTWARVNGAEGRFPALWHHAPAAGFVVASSTEGLSLMQVPTLRAKASQP